MVKPLANGDFQGPTVNLLYGNLQNYLLWCKMFAKLVNITPITMVHGPIYLQYLYLRWFITLSIMGVRNLVDLEKRGSKQVEIYLNDKFNSDTYILTFYLC